MPDILLVMRKLGNIRVLSETLKKHHHTCAGVDTHEALEAILDQGHAPDLALIDVAGFGKSVWSICDDLQRKGIPFIVLSAKQELHLSSKTLRYGAMSILEKPVIKASLLELISGITETGAQ